MAPSDIRFFTPAELELAASFFLEEYNKPQNLIPVEIDLIIEREFDIRVLDFGGLQEFHGLEAYLALGCHTIYVDRNYMDLEKMERRYRFTLAEEIAHFILHKDLFKGVKTVEEYLKVSDELSFGERSRMQRDARRLAGAILMPADIFERKAREQAVGTSLTGASLRNIVIIPYLANIFNVSEATATVRYEQLGLDSMIN